MRHIISWTLLFIAALILQSTLVPVIGIGAIQPDLPLIFLFIFSIRWGVMPGLYVGFLLGLAQDVYSPAILGQHALAKTVTGFFIGLFNERLMRTDVVTKIVLVVLAFFIHDILIDLVVVAKKSGTVRTMMIELAVQTLPRILYSLVFVVVYYIWDTYRHPSSHR
jgi:rod shape-determining protein MreD